MEFEEAMMVRAAAQGDQKARAWLDDLEKRSLLAEVERLRAAITDHRDGLRADHELWMILDRP